MGPALLGRLHIASMSLPELSKHHAPLLDFVYWMGLLLLMFPFSGAETKHFLFARSGERWAGWRLWEPVFRSRLGMFFRHLLGGGTVAGPKGNKVSLIIISAVAVAVRSVPVISKIFAASSPHSLGPFLGVAVLEDIVLWAALAVATALGGTAILVPRQITYHLISTVAFFAVGFSLLPGAVKRINKSKLECA